MQDATTSTSTASDADPGFSMETGASKDRSSDEAQDAATAGEAEEKAVPTVAVLPDLETATNIEKNSAPPSESQEVPESKKQAEVRPFIHGRHTCDSCLTTPIVGKRYHAKNLPDYDLCQRCFENYGGKEIEFEAAELGKS